MRATRSRTYGKLNREKTPFHAFSWNRGARGGLSQGPPGRGNYQENRCCRGHHLASKCTGAPAKIATPSSTLPSGDAGSFAAGPAGVVVGPLNRCCYSSPWSHSSRALLDLRCSGRDHLREVSARLSYRSAWRLRQYQPGQLTWQGNEPGCQKTVERRELISPRAPPPPSASRPRADPGRGPRSPSAALEGRSRSSHRPLSPHAHPPRRG